MSTLDTLKKEEKNWRNDKSKNKEVDDYFKNELTIPKNKELIERMKIKILK